MKRLFSTSALAVALAILAVSCGSTTSTPMHTTRSTDSALCPFPLEVTLRSPVGPVQAETVLKFPLTGPSTITLRNTSTGRSATLDSSDAYAKNTENGSVTFTGHQVWFWAQDNPVPFLQTDGEVRLIGPRLKLGGDAKASVIDPCALVSSSKPSTTPATTSAPWQPPAFPLSHIAAAGLIPVIGNLARHDHVHLDVIVNDRPVKVPEGIGLVEPVDTGPCPAGPLFGDCRTHHIFFSAVANSPVHTHGASGIIHIETDRLDAYTLGQFFDEWDVRLTSTCIGGYCAGGGKELRAYVNGRVVSGDPGKIVLTNHQEIAVVFGGPSDFGSVPATYRGGWPGLGCGGPGEISC